MADELTTLKESGQQVFIPSGQIIFKEGDAGDGLYLVDEGLVEISAKAGENERRVLASIGPNTFFGEMAAPL